MGKGNRRASCVRMTGHYVIGLMLFGAGLAATAQAADGANLGSGFRPGGIASVEQADRALDEAARERAVIEARYVAEENECYPRFFATSCIDGAKERRRQSLVRLRSIEQEANAFKRHARVLERDAALQKKEETAAAKQQSNATIALPVETAIVTQADAEPASPTGLSSTAQKPARRQNKATPARTGEQKADEASMRARKVAAYERKVKEAEARQREVEARKLEKARQREEHTAASQAASN